MNYINGLFIYDFKVSVIIFSSTSYLALVIKLHAFVNFALRYFLKLFTGNGLSIIIFAFFPLMQALDKFKIRQIPIAQTFSH